MRNRAPVVVHDVHARIHRTEVAAVATPTSLEALREVVARARRAGTAISIAGGRHAMGGQPFGRATTLVDSRGLRRILAFDLERGTVTVEAGIQWPELIRALRGRQRGDRPWTIAQKQTGADRLTIGGSLSANVHGRGLTMRPIVQDVEALSLVDARGRLLRCSRHEHPELFRLVIGGYGLFGLIYAVTLRLVRRQRLERRVAIMQAEEVLGAFAERIACGHVYGDFQFAIDPASPDFLRRGVLATYRPAAEERTPREGRHLSAGAWRELLHLAHTDKTRAFERYCAHYLATHGQRYDSDGHQLSPYLDDYHRDLDRRLGARHPATEVITELYVPRAALPRFLTTVAGDLRRHDTDVIYGTVRLIERDDETFLAWARRSWACIVLNLHVEHTRAALRRARDAFRRLIDRAIELGGSFYLTYHRFATRAQIDACHPRMAAFLRHKRRFDPEERFRSDWYLHLRRMYG